jgi:cytochrome c5
VVEAIKAAVVQTNGDYETVTEALATTIRAIVREEVEQQHNDAAHYVEGQRLYGLLCEEFGVTANMSEVDHGDWWPRIEALLRDNKPTLTVAQHVEALVKMGARQVPYPFTPLGHPTGKALILPTDGAA